jgi:iron complex transport system ATP-binding protein
MVAEKGTVLDLRGVRVTAPPDRVLLEGIDWRVRSSEHWVVLGPNGAGKTTLLGLCGARRHPSAGSCSVLGRRLGRTDVRHLWTVVGAVDASLAGRFSERLSVADVVLTGAGGTPRLLRGRCGAPERARAQELIALLGCEALSQRAFATCSAGERQRVLIARALMAEPALLLLDEPSTGLDLPAREALLAGLDGLTAAHPALATVTVTHHVEEIPASATHALLLAGGRTVACGPLEEALTALELSRCLEMPIELSRHDGRYAARARRRVRTGDRSDEPLALDR